MKENPNSTNTPSNGEPNAGDAGLLRELAALSRALQPVNDPWQKILNRMNVEQAPEQANEFAGQHQRGDSWKKGWLALAASVLLVAVSSLFIMTSSETQGPVSQPMAANADEISDEIFGLHDMRMRISTNSVEREYQAAFREFARFEAADNSPSSFANEEIRQGWEMMLQLEAELLTAMAQHPENQLLKQRLMQLRAHQLQLLHVIADSGQAPRRNLI